MNYYALSEYIPELANYTGTLPKDDWLIGECQQCHTWFDVDAEIDHGRVIGLREPVPA